MKLMVLACLAAAALARPESDSLYRHHLSASGHSPRAGGLPTRRSTSFSPVVRPEGYPFKSSGGQLAGYRGPPPASSGAKKLADQRDRDAQITSFQSERSESGAVHSFSADNGLQQQETIELRTVYREDEYGQQTAVTIPIYRGAFKFVQPDGSIVQRSYSTDENGELRIDGADLPTPPSPPQPPHPTYQ